MADFAKNAREHPVITTLISIVLGLGALAAAWQAFSDRPLVPAVWDALVQAFDARSVLAFCLVLSGLAALGGLVAVVAGSVQNRKEARRLAAQLAAAEAEHKSLQTLLKEAHDARDKADAEVGHIRNELVTTKREMALDALRRYGNARFTDGKGERVKPTVTIRFVGYGDDYDLVQQIQKAFREHTGWEVSLDGTNQPALQRAEKFKVLFESGVTQSFDELAWAFSQSGLLDATVGKVWADREDSLHLVVKVLPSG